MGRRRLFLIAMSLAAVYLAVAAHTAYKVSAALGEKNAATVAAYIDFPSVKASLKEQLTTRLMAGSLKELNKADDFGAHLGAGLVKTIAPGIINNMIDELVTPRGLADLLSFSRNSDAVGGDGKPAIGSVMKRFRILSPTHFMLYDNENLSIVFAFEGWSWKITSITLPQNLFGRNGK